MTNFYDYYLICGPTLVAGGIRFKISFRDIFLLFVYILKFVSFLMENEYGRFRFLRHTVLLEIHTRIIQILSISVVIKEFLFP